MMERDAAALNEHKDVLDEFRFQEQPFTVLTFAAASLENGIEMCQWLYNGRYWNGEVIGAAISKRNYTLAHWLILNWCPCSKVIRNFIDRFWNSFQMKKHE
jgi:hypothetical protein